MNKGTNMLEIKLKESTDFLKIRETLTRMGIANSNEKILWQSCHILHKQGSHYICHFKEMLQLDGLNVEISEEDYQRRNNIAHLLTMWSLCELVEAVEHSSTPNFRVIGHKESKDWTLKYKYRIGI